MKEIEKKATIGIAKKTVEDIFKTKCQDNPNIVSEDYIQLFEPKVEGKGYYKHPGWVVNLKEDARDGDHFLVEVLDNGIVVSLVRLPYHELEQPRAFYVVKNDEDYYNTISENKYFEHYNFNYELKPFVYYMRSI